jgi:hypothetical protein
VLLHSKLAMSNNRIDMLDLEEPIPSSEVSAPSRPLSLAAGQRRCVPQFRGREGIV